MRIPGLPDSGALRGALVAVAVAAVVLLFAVVDASRVDRSPVQPPLDLLRPPSGLAGPVASPPVRIDGDPFAEDGALPLTRYRLPGDEYGVLEDAVPETLPEVLGTAVATEGRSFATVRLGSIAPRVLYQGDTIGAFTVRTIERGAVTFTRASGDPFVVRTSAFFIRS